MYPELLRRLMEFQRRQAGPNVEIGQAEILPEPEVEIGQARDIAYPVTTDPTYVPEAVRQDRLGNQQVLGGLPPVQIPEQLAPSESGAATGLDAGINADIDQSMRRRMQFLETLPDEAMGALSDEDIDRLMLIDKPSDRRPAPGMGNLNQALDMGAISAQEMEALLNSPNQAADMGAIGAQEAEALQNAYGAQDDALRRAEIADAAARIDTQLQELSTEQNLRRTLIEELLARVGRDPGPAINGRSSVEGMGIERPDPAALGLNRADGEIQSRDLQERLRRFNERAAAMGLVIPGTGR